MMCCRRVSTPVILTLTLEFRMDPIQRNAIHCHDLNGPSLTKIVATLGPASDSDPDIDPSA